MDRWGFLGRLWLAAIFAAGFAASSASAAPAAGWAEGWAKAQVGEGVRAGKASAAVVAVVQDGRTLVLKGYGVADKPGGRPVDPDRDQFQIASVSKTFTAALLAKLEEQGRVASLDEPVGRYLKRAALPVKDGRAITFRQLVTHSAGFEERGYGYFAYGRTSIPAAGDYIKRAIPAQVRTPGSRIVYANIDPPLVGAAIEDVTGRTLQQQISEALFAPLGMSDTTLNYAPDGGGRVVGAYAGSKRIPGDFNAPFFAPTGSVQTTGRDMTLYMNAMLGGRPDVLSLAVLARLTTPLAANDPALDSLGMYWFLTGWGPIRVVEHAGGLGGVAAWIILVPERKLGVFIAWAGGAPPLDYGVLHDSFLTAALGPPPPPRPMVGASDLSGYVGRYLDERRPQTTPEVVFALDAGETVSVGQGGLMVDGKGPYIETAPGVFVRRVAAGRRGDMMAFRDGLLLTRTSYAKRVSGWSDPANQRLAALIGFGLSLSGLLALFWPKGWAKRPAMLGGLIVLVPPVCLFLPGSDGGLMAAMQHGSSLRFTLITLAMAGLAATAGWLIWGLVRRAGPDLAGSWRAKIAAVHGALVALGLLTTVAVLLTWRFGVLI